MRRLTGLLVGKIFQQRECLAKKLQRPYAVAGRRVKHFAAPAVAAAAKLTGDLVAEVFHLKHTADEQSHRR